MLYLIYFIKCPQIDSVIQYPLRLSTRNYMQLPNHYTYTDYSHVVTTELLRLSKSNRRFEWQRLIAQHRNPKVFDSLAQSRVHRIEALIVVDGWYTKY